MEKNYSIYCSDPFRRLTMKLRKKIPLLLFMFFAVLSVQGQNVTVTGAVTGNGSYGTLGAAFAAIGTSQTGANINIAITGNTTETAVASLGAGDWSSLTIIPTGTWTITGNLASELIRFDGADNVTINGLNSGGNGLTISNISTSNVAGTSTIKFQGDATSNTITNCSVLGSGALATTTAGGVIYFAAGTATGNDGNTISDCNIGPAGVNLPSKLIYAYGAITSETAGNSGITITNCNLYDYFLNAGCAAVYAQAGNSDWTITNNRIYQSATRTFSTAGTFYGIFYQNANFGSNVEITGNTIGFADNLGVGTLTLTAANGAFQAIYFTGLASAAKTYNVNNNTISNVSLSSSAGTCYGIYNAIASASNSIVNINNNTVRNIATSTSTGSMFPIYGGSAATLNCNNNVIDAVSRTGAGQLYGISYGIVANATVNSNTITNVSSTSTTSTLGVAGIFGNGTAQIETITNNSITGLASLSTGNQPMYGISVGSGAGNKTIQNNILSNFTVPNTAAGVMHGIRMSAGGALNDVSGNTISSFSGPNTGGGNGINGISMSAGTITNVYKNKVYGLNGPGVSSGVIGFNITAGGTYNIYNNIIGGLTTPIASDGGAEPHLVIGINSWGMPMNLYHNTIVLNGANSGTHFGSSVVSTGGPLTLRNNILVNNLPANGIGVSVVLRLSGGVSNYGATSDNNLFRGTAIHTKTGTTDLDTTLNAFKIRTGNRDLSSVSENPSFISTFGSDPTYLHITAGPTQIESGGTSIAMVTDDFDGDVRNASTPDIGADEFTGTAVDLLGPIITHTPDPACAAGSRTISATFTDMAGVPTTGPGVPVAYWRVNNGAYTPAVGTSQGAGVYQFTIGTGTVSGDSVNYYFVAQDLAATPNVSVYPSPGAAGLSANPPMATTPTTSPLILAIPMGGTYTVGTTGNYATLTAAVADYNARCLTGPVTFVLQDASYPSETYPININQNADASAINKLTIKPAAGVTATISGNSATTLLNLNGADYVTIDGLNAGGSALTISNTSTAATAGTILFQSDATNNTVTNCSVLGSTTVNPPTNAGGVIAFGTGIATGNDGNTISNCKVTAAGANLPSKLIGSNGSTTTVAMANSGNTITNCELYDYFLATGNCAAVYVAGGNTDWTITNNKIYETAARTYTAAGILYGIAFNNGTSGDNVQITGNTIGYANNAGAGTLTLNGSTVVGEFQGIFFSGSSTAATACNLNNNTIANIALASSTGRFYAIYNGAGASSNTININGNTIRNIATTTTTGAVNPIYAGAATILNCNNNTIDNISRNGAGSGVFHGINYGAPTTVTINSNSITNLNSTNASYTGIVSGISSVLGSVTETINGNTITGLTSTSTGNQTIYGICVGTGSGNKTIQNNIVSSISVPTAATGGLYAIKMSAGGALNVISGNTVGSISGPNNASIGTNGMFINAGTLTNIYNNKIYGLNAAGAAANVYGVMIQGGTNYNIYNNIIGDLTAPNTTSASAQPHQIIAINTWGQAMNLYNNTIVLNGTNSGTGFGSSVLSTTGPITLRNNIMINNLPASGVQGVSTILRFGASGVTNYAAVSDNNLFKGSVIYTTDGTVVDNTLAAFKTRTGNRDLSSISENPTFVSTTGSNPNYLHIDTTVPTQIESGGAPIATVTTDFDGDARNATTPDIGADEFTGVINDLVGPVITHTPNAVCGVGSVTISATITDATGVPTSGAGLPVAYWKINSGAYTAAVGTSMGAGVYNFTIGTGSVAEDIVSYYFVAQDAVATPNVSVYPTVGAAGLSANPPMATTAPTTPFKLYTPMTGVYTVGTAGNYATLTAAVADYNVRCLGGPVTFSLLDATYGASETYPVTINQNADASAVNTLTIKPASGVTATISGTNTSAILKLNGADYVIIDGSNNGTTSRDLTIVNTNNASNAVIWLASTTLAGATNNTIKNTVVTGQGITGTRSAIISCGSTITYAEKANNGNTYRNNVISLAKNGIEILGSGAADLQTGTLITQNAIGTSTNALGVTGVTVAAESNGVVSNNTIQKVSAGTITPFTYVGGVMLNNTTGVTVSNNSISDIKSTATLTAVASVAGIVQTATGNTNAVITGNTITGVASTAAGTGTNGARGITILGDGTVASNNMISDIYNFQGAGIGGASTIGISIGNATALGANVSLYNNTVHLFGPHAGYSTNTTSGLATCIYIATSGTGLNIRNNILVNSYENSTSTGDKSYAIYTTATDNTQFAAIDNNDYVAGNATLANSLGYLGADKTTLVEMIAAFGGNANSKAIVPVFVSNVDLHLPAAGNAYMDNLGTSIAGITTDIDGNTRNALTPDMGADEFTSLACTAAVGGSTTPSAASICNSGSVTVVATGYSTGETTMYQWQSSVDSAFTTPVNIGTASAVYADLTTTANATTYYRLAVTCAVNSLTNYSTVSTVTVNTTAQPTASSQTFCNSATVADLVAAGTGIQWYAGPSGGTALLSTDALATGNYYVTQTISGCESPRLMVSVTVNTTAQPTASAQTFCAGATVADLVASGVGIQWHNGPSGGSPLASTVALATGDYYVSQTVSGCVSPRLLVSVTIGTIPQPTASAQTFCGSATVADLMATGTGIQWYAGPAGGTALTSTAALSTGTYYVTQTITGCESARLSVAVTVNSATAQPTASAQTFCNGATVANLAATGTGVQWYAGPTGGSALASTTALSTGTYYATQTISGCESPRLSVSVTVNTTALPTASAQTFCSGATVANLAATGTGVQWYSGPSGGSALAPTTALSTGTYYATQTISGCESPRLSVAVTVNTTALPTASAQTFCNGATVSNLTATGTGVQWYAGPTGGSALASTTALSTGTYYATQTISGCESPRLSVSVTVNTTALPTASAQTFCNGATVANLAATGTGVQWYSGPSGGSALASTTALSTGTYYATQTISGCESPRLSVSVTVNTTALPTASAQTFCNSATVASLAATGTGVQWYAGPTGGSALSSTTALSSGTYYVTQTISGCESPRLAVPVTVNVVGAPTGMSTQTISVAVPSDATIEDLVASGSNIVWYPTAADALAGTNAISAGTQLTNGNVYYAMQTVGGCRSTSSLAVTVTVTLGVKDFALSNLKLYPNPVTDILNIENGQTISTVEIYSIAGQRVVVKTVNTMSASVDMSSLAGGTYLVKIVADDAVKTVKVIKK